MPDTPLVSCADLFGSWRKALFDDKPTPTWKVGAAFDHVEIGPGGIILIGGAPRIGKSALIIQMAFEALFLDAALRLVVANVEMLPASLLDRKLSRLSGVPLTTIRR